MRPPNPPPASSASAVMAPLRHVLAQFVERDRALAHVERMLMLHPSFRPCIDPRDVNRAAVAHPPARPPVLCLAGTLPIVFFGATYHIPLELWLAAAYPASPPHVYIKPTDSMELAVSEHVDTNGRVLATYLSHWDHRRSDLVALIASLQHQFSSTPPVYARRGSTGPAADLSSSRQAGADQYQQQQVAAASGRPAAGDRGAAGAATGGYLAMPPNASSSQLARTSENKSSALAAINRQLAFDQASPHLSSSSSGSFPSNATSSYGLSASRPVVAPSAAGATKVMNSSAPSFLPPALDPKSHTISQLRSAAVRKLDAYFAPIHSKMIGEIEELQCQASILDDKLQRLYRGIDDLGEYEGCVQSSSHRLDENLAQVKSEVDKLLSSSVVGADEILLPFDSLHAKLLEAYSDDLAIEDTVHMLAKLAGDEKISHSIFLKQVRSLAKDRFFCRSMINACHSKLGIKRPQQP